MHKVLQGGSVFAIEILEKCMCLVGPICHRMGKIKCLFLIKIKTLMQIKHLYGGLSQVLKKYINK